MMWRHGCRHCGGDVFTEVDENGETSFSCLQCGRTWPEELLFSWQAGAAEKKAIYSNVVAQKGIENVEVQEAPHHH